MLMVLCCLIIREMVSAQQPGALDYSFGDSGKVISKNFGDCYAMSVQADSKIVCLGDSGMIGVENLRLARYLPDGTLDSAFGKNGIVDPALTETNITPTSIIVQPDQKIIAACSGYKAGVPTLVLLRLLPDGSPDAGFGKNGIGDSTYGIGESFPYIALQPNGKILVLGWYYPGFILLRYNTDGSLDESFGNKGEVITTFGAGTVPTAIALQADGKIVTSGDYGGGVGYSRFLLARYNTDGSLDESFGNKGVTTTDYGKYGDYIKSIAIQTDGKIVGAGVTGTDFNFQNENIAVVRYQSNGKLDSSFGQQGKATVVFDGTNSQANSLLLTADGKILLGGGIGGSAEGSSADFALIRLLSTGTLDSSFGNAGGTITDFGLYETGAHIAFQKNKIVLTGTSYMIDPQQQYNYALARYYNDSLAQKQIIITKIRRWLQHHNGIEWDNTGSMNSYVVQRSYDGIHFSPVARITPGNQSYITYSDAAPLNGTNYYRLQTTNSSNAVTNSNVIAISNDNDIKVSPNPATGMLHIEGLSSSQKTKITIVDLSGNIAMSQQLSANSSSYNLNIASLHAGNYMLKIETNGEVVTKQFVKE